MQKIINSVLEKKYPLVNPLYRHWKNIRYGVQGLIYMLHRVDDICYDKLYPNENMKVSPAFLEKIIKRYQKEGFLFISLDQLYEHLTSQHILDKPFIVFTLDDGYLDNYTQAYPVFKKYNVPFIVNITTSFPDGEALLWWYMLEDIILKNDFVRLLDGEVLECASERAKNEVFMKLRERCLKFGKEELELSLCDLFRYYPTDLYSYVKGMSMTWEQIAAMSKDPLCTIGGHTVTHPAFNRLTKDEIVWEVSRGCERLSEYIDKEIMHFAFPYGTQNEVGERELDIMKQFDFKTIVTTRRNMITQESDLQKLSRIMLCEL